MLANSNCIILYYYTGQQWRSEVLLRHIILTRRGRGSERGGAQDREQTRARISMLTSYFNLPTSGNGAWVRTAVGFTFSVAHTNYARMSQIISSRLFFAEKIAT